MAWTLAAKVEAAVEDEAGHHDQRRVKMTTKAVTIPDSVRRTGHAAG